MFNNFKFLEIESSNIKLLDLNLIEKKGPKIYQLARLIIKSILKYYGSAIIKAINTALGIRSIFY